MSILVAFVLFQVEKVRFGKSVLVLIIHFIRENWSWFCIQTSEEKETEFRCRKTVTNFLTTIHSFRLQMTMNCRTDHQLLGKKFLKSGWKEKLNLWSVQLVNFHLTEQKKKLPVQFVKKRVHRDCYDADSCKSCEWFILILFQILNSYDN